jgi:hypothetical protein
MFRKIRFLMIANSFGSFQRESWQMPMLHVFFAAWKA